jgi:putative molybdopterin biosynthesis protein
VGKQVRISQSDIDRYLAANKTGPQYADNRLPANRPDQISPDQRADAPGENGREGLEPIVERSLAENPDPNPVAVIISGQDMCLDLLVNRLSVTGTPVLRSYVGCYNGLYSLYHGRVTMSAAHLWDAETDTYNYPFIRRLLPGLPVGVFRLVGRMEGLYVRKGNPLNIRSWKDFSRPDILMINRERGSGVRILLDQKLGALGINAAGIRGYAREASSHLACASTVAKGGAEVGCGCERGVEGVSGVEFVPLQMEWYDFLFRLADRNTPAVRAVSSYIASDEFKRDLSIMGGYDLSQTGRYEEY